MSILTKAEFASIAAQKTETKKLYGTINENRKFSKATATTSIFLSHAHSDKELIEQAKLFFENLSISVYVDWADKTMPEKPTGETAEKIKSQIVSYNDKFVLLATNNAVTSRWCNWEIGIADPFKLSRKKIALLPLSENNGSWVGNEYLQIYPRIERSSVNKDDYYVWYPDGNLQNIKDWLKN